jgi:hypothetical protein
LASHFGEMIFGGRKTAPQQVLFNKKKIKKKKANIIKMILFDYICFFLYIYKKRPIFPSPAYHLSSFWLKVAAVLSKFAEH